MNEICLCSLCSSQDSRVNISVTSWPVVGSVTLRGVTADDGGSVTLWGVVAGDGGQCHIVVST